MFLHLGQDTTVLTEDLIGIFDLDTCTISAKNPGVFGPGRKGRTGGEYLGGFAKKFCGWVREKKPGGIYMPMPATIKKMGRMGRKTQEKSQKNGIISKVKAALFMGRVFRKMEIPAGAGQQ